MLNERPAVSVIVPVWNDTVELCGLLEHLPAEVSVEIVVVVAEPVDPALRALEQRRPDVRWTRAARGRGCQMNTGAGLARGVWLVFLHADTRLAPGWLEEIRALDPREVAGGSFRFAMRSHAPIARVLEFGVRLRTIWLNLPYGDQALFLHRDVFDAVGGYREMPIMEDLELVRRLRRHGLRLWHSSLAATSSARRWERDGWVTRSASNLALALLFLLGVHEGRLARAYVLGLRTLFARFPSDLEYEPTPGPLTRGEGAPSAGPAVRRTLSNGEGAC